MNTLIINTVRGRRCVLVLVTDGEKVRQYEYEQDSDMIMSTRDGIHKWENGDDNFRLKES